MNFEFSDESVMLLRDQARSSSSITLGSAGRIAAMDWVAYS
jgi:hypothetical protein